MKRWIERIESIFVSAAFAEMGEHHASMEILVTHGTCFPGLWPLEWVEVPAADGG